MFGISGTELFIIALFAIIVFGPDKLPALGRTVGRFMKEFKKVQDDVETMIKKEMSMVEDQAKDESAAPGGEPAPEIPVITQTSLADDADEEEEEEE